MVVTLVLKASRVLAQGAYVKPAPDSTRKSQSHSLEKLPWERGSEGSDLRRDEVKSAFS